MTKINEVLNARYSTNYRIIYDGNTQMTLEEVVKRLNKQDERIQELEESLGFCRDLLDGTCNSTRMKELHKIIGEMVTDD